MPDKPKSAGKQASETRGATRLGGRPPNAADQVYDAIIQGLRTGVFVPGQNLVEPDLVARLGVSRGPVREGLKLLEAAGIVVWNPHRGASIGQLDVAAILDLLQALEPLFRLAVRLAALHCESKSDQKRMKDAAARIAVSGTSGNRAEYFDDRQSFYDTLIDIGGNRELARLITLERTYLYRAQVEPLRTDAQRTQHVMSYARIAGAILDRSPAAADEAMKLHFGQNSEVLTGTSGSGFSA
jgi:DNA-binding GntR family transcriptional regulator